MLVFQTETGNKSWRNGKSGFFWQGFPSEANI